MKSFIMSRIIGRLKLTDEQKEKAVPIVEKWFPKMLEAWKSSAPDVRDAFFGMFDEIEPFLTEQQQEELKKTRQRTLRRITMNNSFKLDDAETKEPTEKKTESAE